MRWGRRPRFLIPFYLTDAPVQGRTFTFPDGEKLQLMGGQFVAFGPHKDTGQPYEWENWDAEWPRLSTAQLNQVLSEVPLRAGTSLRFSADHETASPEELQEAKPQTQDEWQAGRDAAMRYTGLLKQELMGKTEGRGSTIFALVGVLKFAELNGMCTRQEIEDAITGAGQRLDEGLGGRTLGQEIERHDQLPVLRGNLIMQAVIGRRTILQGLLDSTMYTPTLIARTGFEISLEDNNDELPWLLYQRILCGEVHFFTGHSGAGKSTVVTDLCVSYLTGRAWLDADVERAQGHVLWIAAEDDYGTERRVRHLLKQEPNARELAARFHLIRGNPDPMAFELQCIAQVQAMAAMGMRVDLIIIDTWGASGLCFADNDTEAVLKAMFVLKNVARRTGAAEIVTDHLPKGSGDDEWTKGNGAKSGGSGFVYRVTKAAQDRISIDCGKERGCPKPPSYVGRVVSENYGKDSKGRTTTVNVFKRDILASPKESVQNNVLRLAAMLPGATVGGMDALRSGQIVPFESVAADVGQSIKGDRPGYVMSKDAAQKMFEKVGMLALLNSGHLRTMYGSPFLAVYTPTGSVRQELVIPWTVTLPTQSKMPWE